MKDITYDLSIIMVIIVMMVPIAFAQVEDIPDVSNEIDDGFDEIGRWFKGLIGNANITGTETPLNTTEAELQNLLDSSVQTGKDGKNFLFSFHKLIENVIYAISPIDIDPLFVLLISWGVGSFAVWMIFKRSFKHMVIFAGIFGVVILLFMIGGINPKF